MRPVRLTPDPACWLLRSQRAFARIGAPLHVLDIDREAARAVYGFDYPRVRPDLHVVWRGNRLPEAPVARKRRQSRPQIRCGDENGVDAGRAFTPV